ncbi:hypothetical protein BGZ63DRAFT_424058 [Mariannaea sp. PMI_226]|nr:hypothetical protein BGZ63DRAFT_424058 [Mariannaea sp. PMI_226]
MALLKTLILAVAAVGVAQAGPCKPSTTSTAPPAATTTACVPGLKNPQPAGICNLKGHITSGNKYLDYSSSYGQNIERCFKGCKQYAGCTVMRLSDPPEICEYYGPANTLTTDGSTGIGAAFVNDLSCYDFCDASTSQPI